jgi:hypothetical protein
LVLFADTMPRRLDGRATTKVFAKNFSQKAHSRQVLSKHDRRKNNKPTIGALSG